MTEILVATWSAVTGVLSGLWDLLEVVCVWLGDVLYHLHVDAPRTEGLLIGVILTWLLLRRDRHPLLRVLSAPLKLVVDILDLLWDQVVESIGDCKNTVVGWVSSAWNWSRSKVVGASSWVMDSLRNVKNKLSKKSGDDSSE